MCRHDKSCDGRVHHPGHNASRTLPGVITSPVVSGGVVTVWVLNPDEWGPQTFTVNVEIK